MRLITLALCALVTACGGAAPTVAQAPAPVAVQGMVFMGDSITMLWPLADYVQGATNAGVSGNETGQMLARFQSDALDQHPGVLVLLGGTNDIRHLDSADTTNLFAMADRAKAAGIRVIVGTIPPMDLNLGSYPDIEKQLVPVLNDKIRKGAMLHGYEVVDYYPLFLRMDGSINADLYADALLHPNKAGYDAMWSALKSLVK